MMLSSVSNDKEHLKTKKEPLWDAMDKIKEELVTCSSAGGHRIRCLKVRWNSLDQDQKLFI
jgi:hypothetical protein